REIVAICDSEIIGKRFEDEKFQLDVKESFFKGEKKNEDEVIEIILDKIKEDATFNIIGEKSVNTAIKAGVISEGGVKRIGGIPFAMILV
ncbi:MAG: DUF424 family protein, partial [Nanoarchaeota archaeon]